MKELTRKEFLDAPLNVQYVYIRTLLGQPVSATLLNEAITESPSYFPEEAEEKRKWDAIPQDVHAAYWKEYWELHNSLCKDIPHYGMGILYYTEHPQEYMEYTKAMDIVSSKLELLKKELHLKYYSKYGVKKVWG